MFESPLSAVCEQLVAVHFEAIRESILAGSDPATACALSGYCEGAPARPAPKAAPRKAVRAKQSHAQAMCDGCQGILGYAAELADAGLDDREINRRVLELGRTLPSMYGPMARDVVAPALSDALASLKQGTSVFDACGAVNLCSSKCVARKPPAGKRTAAAELPKDIWCDLCQQLVSDLADLLNETIEPDVEQLIAQLCSVVPYPVNLICEGFLDAELYAIIEFIEAGIDALNICQSIGACPGQAPSQALAHLRAQARVRPARAVPRKAAHKRTPKTAQGDLLCDLCTQLVTDLQLLLNQTLEPDVEQLIAQLCDPLPYPVNVLCKQFLDENLEIIINFIEEELDSLQICQLIGACPASKVAVNGGRMVSARRSCIGLFRGRKAAKRASKAAGSDILCDLCTQLVTDIQLLLNETLEPDVEQLIAQLCDPQPYPVNVLCKQFLDDNLEIIINFIEEELDTLQICQLIGACPTSKAAANPGPRRLAARRRRANIAGRPITLKRGPKKAQGDLLCDLCTQLITDLQLLLNQTLEPDVEQLIAQLCDPQPYPINVLCKQFLDDNLEIIINFIEEELDTLQICQLIGACPASKKLAKKITVRRPPGAASPKITLKRRPKTAGGDLLCDLCTQLITDLELLLNQTLEPDVEQLIAQLCDPQPYPINVLCKQFLDENLEIIINFIEEELDTLQICQLIGACPKTKTLFKLPRATHVRKPRAPRAAKKVNGDLLCDICQQLVADVELLLNQTIEPDLEELVAKLCDPQPYPLNVLCEQFLDQNLEIIINFVELELDQLQICQLIGACPASTLRGVKKAHLVAARRAQRRVPHRVPRAKRHAAVQGDLLCDICRQIVKDLQLLLNQTIEPDLEELVAQLCDPQPYPLNILCKQFLDKNLEALINFIDQGLDELDVCRLLGACPNATRHGRPARLLRRRNAAALVCDVAQDYVAFVEQLTYEGATEADIAPLVHALTASLPPAAGALAGASVARNLHAIVAAVAAREDKFDIARHLQLCGPRDARHAPSLSMRRPTARRLPAGPLCDACRALVADLELYLNGTIEVELDDLIAQTCDQLPWPLSTVCTDIFEEAIDTLIQAIEEAIDEIDVCDNLGFCDAPPAPGVRRARLPRGHRRLAADLPCAVAQDAIAFAALARAEGAPLERRVADACALLPYPAGSICARFVAQNIGEVELMLEAGATAHDIAVQFGLCGPGSLPRPARVLMRRPALKRAPGDIFCDICQDAIQFIEKVVLEGFIEGDLEALVAELCDVLPWPLSTWCSSFLDENIEAIVADIEAGIDGLDICANLGLCGAHAKAAPVPKGKAVLMKQPGDIFCDICKEIVDYIAQLILNGTVEPAIEELVAELCDTFPFPISTWCADFIDQYVEEIIADIEAGIEDICGAIGLCANPPPAEYKRIMQLRAARVRRPAVKKAKPAKRAA